MTEQIKHPAIRYHGGKFRLAPWIIRGSDVMDAIADQEDE